MRRALWLILAAPLLLAAQAGDAPSTESTGKPLVAAPANAADPSGLTAKRGEEPVDITSDEAHVNEADRIVVLTGHVIARQGAVQLRADKVTVRYLPGALDGESARGKIESLEASGDVVVTRPGEVVKSSSAVYKMIEKQILMRGNVVATRGTSVVRGDSLTVDLLKETIKLNADAQNGRVHAIFTAPANGANP